MTKKHYEAIAKIIAFELHLRDYTNDYNGMTDNKPEIATLLTLVSKLANYFESDNKLFDRKKFLTACKNMSQT